MNLSLIKVQVRIQAMPVNFASGHFPNNLYICWYAMDPPAFVLRVKCVS